MSYSLLAESTKTHIHLYTDTLNDLYPKEFIIELNDKLYYLLKDYSGNIETFNSMCKIIFDKMLLTYDFDKNKRDIKLVYKIASEAFNNLDNTKTFWFVVNELVKKYNCEIDAIDVIQKIKTIIGG